MIEQVPGIGTQFASLAMSTGDVLSSTLAQYSIAQYSIEGGEEVIGVAGGIMVLLLTLVVMLAVQIVICFILMTVLNRVPAQYRRMEPAMVWLLLIPIFNLIWMFMVFLRVPESLVAALTAKGDTTVGDGGRQLGLIYCICVLASFIPCVGGLAGIAALVLLILFLVKTWGLSKRLEPQVG